MRNKRIEWLRYDWRADEKIIKHALMAEMRGERSLGRLDWTR